MINPHDSLFKMEKNFVYQESKTNMISFPLGGIGTGCIGLSGQGRLIDWEIFNRPNKNSFNGFSFFAIKAEHKGQIRVAKVLNGDLNSHYIGSSNKKIKGFGFGVDRETLSGLPHFKSTTFKGEFPFAQVSFIDDQTPLDVTLTAYNPFIPLNEDDSSIPAGIFSFEVINQSNEVLDISLVGNLTNPHKIGSVNQYIDYGIFKAIKLFSNEYQTDDSEYGDLTLSTDGVDVSYQSYWYRGGWFDNLTVFWKEFNTPGKFTERKYQGSRVEQQVGVYNHLDVCLLSNHKTLAPGEKGEFRFIISWNFPNCENYWNPGSCCDAGACEPPKWKNYYSTLFEDSIKSAHYIWNNYVELYEQTLEFKSTLFQSTLPDFVIDAISSNLSVLKSPTCLRLTDGTLYGFEGCHGDEGCCEGSCTHVWNYEQVTPFLFPRLARSMRNLDYQAAQFDNGKMNFRILLPIDRTLKELQINAGKGRPAADGQMGGIIKVYREWKISGDTNWLKSIWPKVKKALEYAWEPTNEDLWDADKDGVMEGRQHHTLDMELFGPNSWLTGFYLTALKAASEMAQYLGEENKYREYRSLYDQGRKWANEHLFNGEYFHQVVDLKDKSIVEKFSVEQTYWDHESQEMKYQIGEGCEIDQVIGQWLAHIVGLGYVFDQEKVTTAIKSLFKYNFITSFREHQNTCRIYALNDEQGTVIATWPKNNSPRVPIPYQDECQNGYEYQAACHMIYEGLIEQGLTAVQAIRNRYDGERRNPWNEFECGNNYARSMASYALLLALSRFEYDMVSGEIGFSPRINQENFQCFWSINRGWGEFSHKEGELSIWVKSGSLELRSFRSELLKGKIVSEVSIENTPCPFVVLDNDRVFFETGLIMKRNSRLKIKYKNSV